MLYSSVGDVLLAGTLVKHVRAARGGEEGEEGRLAILGDSEDTMGSQYITSPKP